MSVPDAAEHARVAAALGLLDSIDAQVRAISQQRTLNPIVDYTDAHARGDRAALLATISSLETAIARVGVDSFPLPLPPYPGSLTDIPIAPPSAPAAAILTASAFTDTSCPFLSPAAAEAASAPSTMSDAPSEVAPPVPAAISAAVSLMCPLSSPPSKATTAFCSGSYAASRRTEARIVAAAERAGADEDENGDSVRVGIGAVTASVPSSAVDNEAIASGAGAVIVAAALQAATAASAASLSGPADDSASAVTGRGKGEDGGDRSAEVLAEAAEAADSDDSIESAGEAEATEIADAAERLRRLVSEFDLSACVAACGGRAARQQVAQRGTSPSTGSATAGGVESCSVGARAGTAMSDGEASRSAPITDLSLETGAPEWVINTTAPDATELGKRMEAVAYLTLLYHGHVKERLAVGDRRVKRAEREWLLAQS